MGITIGGNDPIKGIIAICEFLAAKAGMTQADYDEIIRKMQG